MKKNLFYLFKKKPIFFLQYWLYC